MFDRREMIAGALAACASGDAPMSEKYGLFGKMTAAPGKRDELLGYLQAGTGRMPGNILYVLSTSEAEPDAIFIYEVWETRQHHADSLKLPAVQAAIAKARPIIAGFGPERFEMTPVGGVGI
ncbi:MAG: antibiotic biosynthesis monooxygenase [Caulobacter sp.]|nr:antibiotic biosynthesis monooxygenase [Caulobacter sp.]